MPRPKKAGAPQPKKRSRKGCWPCKSRKVKCDENHPSCINCQRQGEACDYNIRLIWGGRGKKKPDGQGQIVFSSAVIDSALGSHSGSYANGPQGDDEDLRPPGIDEVSALGSNKLPVESRTETQSVPYSSRHISDPTKYGPQLIPLASVIDPTLMDNNGAITDIYLRGRQADIPPDLQYEQSYERYSAQLDNTQKLAQPPGHMVSIAARHQLGQLPQFGMRQQQSNFQLSEDETVGEDEGMCLESTSSDRPYKRTKYDPNHTQEATVIGPADMPPPNMGPYSYVYSAHNVPQQSTTPQNSISTPLTPATPSAHSDEGFKNLTAKASPYTVQNSPDFRRLSDTSDPRRLSVESLLSGPPGILEQHESNYGGSNFPDVRTPRTTSSGNGEFREEMTTWGVDRGFRDLDIGKNDDTNAITGGSPLSQREHLEYSFNGEFADWPIEFGFGVQAKDTAFEQNDYYAQ